MNFVTLEVLKQVEVQRPWSANHCDKRKNTPAFHKNTLRQAKPLSFEVGTVRIHCFASVIPLTAVLYMLGDGSEILNV